MRINSVRDSIAFKRSLTRSEIPEYTSVLNEAKKLTGQTGHSIFIMPSACLPQTKELNTGIGHLSSDISQDFFKFIKTYFGINAIKDLPPGQVEGSKGCYCAYKGSAFSLGNHQINPELLTEKEFGELLTPEDIKDIARSNTSAQRSELANFSNVMDNEGAQNKALQKAFKKFEKLDESSPLKSKFKQYVTENAEWLDITRSNEPDAEFFKFKQFLADEHLKIAKTKLNQNGLKLCGDMLIGFSKDEIKAFPKAFKVDEYCGTDNWKTRSLNFDEIFNPESDAYKLLRRKVKLFAKRYDMLRIDAAWLYVQPRITTEAGVIKKDLGDNLLTQIEKWIKEVKGEDFDLKNIIYEFEAAQDDFAAFRGNDLIPEIKQRLKSYGSQHMHITPDEWGFNRGFLNRGFAPDEFILGVGNHDAQPLRQIANGIADEIRPGEFKNFKTPAIAALSRALGINESVLRNPVEFVKAKFADIMSAKHNYLFYMDAFGREEVFDPHWKKEATSTPSAYAYKVATDFQEAYQKALKEGYAFNPMDALEKVFINKGLDKTHPKLFGQILKYKDILQASKVITTPPNVVKTPIYLPIIFCAVGVLGIASGIKYFRNNKKTEKPIEVEEPLKPAEKTPQMTDRPVGRHYSFDDFQKWGK